VQTFQSLGKMSNNRSLVLPALLHERRLTAKTTYSGFPTLLLTELRFPNHTPEEAT